MVSIATVADLIHSRLTVSERRHQHDHINNKINDLRASKAEAEKTFTVFTQKGNYDGYPPTKNNAVCCVRVSSQDNNWGPTFTKGLTTFSS